jgi:hypothetical protein
MLSVTNRVPAGHLQRPFRRTRRTTKRQMAATGVDGGELRARVVVVCDGDVREPFDRFDALMVV